MEASEIKFFFFLKYLSFWLYGVFAAEHGLSLVVARRRYSLAVVHGLLIAVASFAVDHWALGHHGLWRGHGLGSCRRQTPECMPNSCDAWA